MLSIFASSGKALMANPCYTFAFVMSLITDKTSKNGIILLAKSFVWDDSNIKQT